MFPIRKDQNQTIYNQLFAVKVQLHDWFQLVEDWTSDYPIETDCNYNSCGNLGAKYAHL